ncbi:MAG: EpsI family protein [Bryobacterales bacterium]|nr:EpsI family protein [Bryobacteraceae bacterium]MDW8353035.1 EpsI family protein [Bryobacterales bacterium]
MRAVNRTKSALDKGARRVLTGVLLAQAALFYGFSRTEQVPPSRPLSAFPQTLGNWHVQQEGVIEKEILDVLRADDVLSRIYTEPASGRVASLFVAYFRSQRTGQAPHSPKNCLPGSGWVPTASEIIPISLPGQADPIRVNRYVVARGLEKSVVIYWYQSRHQVVASEYEAKVRLVLDAIRYNRTDTALVRVVAPVVNGDEAHATEAAINFVQALFPVLRDYLPS